MLLSGAAYANVTTDRALVPSSSGASIQHKIIVGVAVSGAIIAVIVTLLCFLELRRWHNMKKAVNAELRRSKKVRKGSRQPRGNQGFEAVSAGEPTPQMGAPLIKRPGSQMSSTGDSSARLRQTGVSQQQLLTAQLDQNPDLGMSLGLTPRNGWKVKPGAVVPMERVPGSTVN